MCLVWADVCVLFRLIVKRGQTTKWVSHTYCTHSPSHRLIVAFDIATISKWLPLDHPHHTAFVRLNYKFQACLAHSKSMAQLRPKKSTSRFHNLSYWTQILMWDTSMSLWWNSLMTCIQTFLLRGGHNFDLFSCLIYQ